MRLLIAVVAALALTVPAGATEWLYCNDETQTVTLGLLLGGTDFPAIAGATVSHEETVWATHTAYGPGEPLAVGQAFADGNRFDVDFMDSSNGPLAELRLLRAVEDDEQVYGGTLRIIGRGVWAVGCPGI